MYQGFKGRRLGAAALLAVAVTITVGLAPARAQATFGGTSAGASATGRICYVANLRGLGWQQWVCDGDIAGSTGRSIAMETMQFQPYGMGQLCVTGYVQGFGWQNQRCGGDGEVLQIGTVGQGLQLEGLTLWAGSARLCGNFHWQDHGWSGTVCAEPGDGLGWAFAGKRLEAVALFLS